MIEKPLFTVPHREHSSKGPVDIFFGMTFSDCKGSSHSPGVITGLSANGFLSANIIFDRTPGGLYKVGTITTFSTSVRSIIGEIGLSQFGSGLPDELSPEEILEGLRNLAPHMSDQTMAIYHRGFVNSISRGRVKI